MAHALPKYPRMHIMGATPPLDPQRAVEALWQEGRLTPRNLSACATVRLRIDRRRLPGDEPHDSRSIPG